MLQLHQDIGTVTQSFRVLHMFSFGSRWVVTILFHLP